MDLNRMDYMAKSVDRNYRLHTSYDSLVDLYYQYILSFCENEYDDRSPIKTRNGIKAIQSLNMQHVLQTLMVSQQTISVLKVLYCVHILQVC